jgi:hypothetical protein
VRAKRGQHDNIASYLRAAPRFSFSHHGIHGTDTSINAPCPLLPLILAHRGLAGQTVEFTGDLGQPVAVDYSVIP